MVRVHVVGSCLVCGVRAVLLVGLSLKYSTVVLTIVHLATRSIWL